MQTQPNYSWLRPSAPQPTTEAHLEDGPRGNRATQSGVSPPKLLALILKRVRTSDYWTVPPGGAPSHRRSPLTDALLDRHLNGGHRVGACPIERGQSTTRIALLDLDSHGGETDWSTMCGVASEIIASAASHGLRAIPVRSSGGQGIHLLFIWNDPQDARSVRRLLGQVLDECGLKNGTRGVRHYEVEIFPKQDSVPADGWGSMFVLPFAGKSVALDPATLEEIDPGAVKLEASDPVPVVEPEPVRAPSSIEVPPEIADVRDALAAIDPNDYDYEGWVKLLFSVHAGTDGSEEGFAVFDAWSQRFARYTREETEKQWRFARSNKAGGITIGTLFAEAAKRGWVHPMRRPSIEGLEVIVDEGEPIDVGAEKSRLLDVFTRGEQTDADCVAFHALPGEAQVEIMRIVERAATEETMKAVRDAIERVRESAARAPVAALSLTLTRNKTGYAEGTYDNVYAACADPQLIGIAIGYDEFRDEIVVSADGGQNWRAMADEDYVTIHRLLERARFKRVAHETLRRAVNGVAKQVRRFDTAKLWLDRLQWDGVPRIGRFLSTYLGAEDSDYTRAVGRYTWTAMAGRVLNPGCQADMVPVLVGGQGARKTSTVRAMVPAAEHFAEIDLSKRDTDLSRTMRGLLVGELGELRGLATRDLEAVKTWVTQRFESWVPKYLEFSIKFPRRCVFVGTTNEAEFLADSTGERRWLPVQVGNCDPEAVAADREQLWAEAAAVWRASGIAWQDAERLARAEHAKYKVHDAWADSIAAWLDGCEGFEKQKRREQPFTTGEVMAGALGIAAAQQRVPDQKRVGRILQSMGFTRDEHQQRVDGQRARFWRAA